MRKLKQFGMDLVNKVHSVGSGVGRGLAALLVLGLVFAGDAVQAATDILAYDSASGSITWDFSSIITMLFTALAAAIGAGVLIWLAIKGYGFMKKFVGGR